ncbi:hypothetical protein FOA52_012605 [Chlamydomonas sp. UWO 241]|nr:hypothetical protein FOA52_012605 [Chlamydomonas sp. UWO 241]
MVYFEEPSDAYAKALRKPGGGHHFSQNDRFASTGNTIVYLGSSPSANAYAGTSTEDRDARSPSPVHDTNTHPATSGRITGGGAHATIAEELRRSLAGTAALRTRGPRIVTMYSLLKGETRLENVKAPYTEEIGPGAYHIEWGSPGVGTLSPHAPSRGAIPGHDPNRSSSGFMATARQSIEIATEGGHLGSYAPVDFRPSTRAVDFGASGTQRPHPADFRFCARIKESGRHHDELLALTPLVDRSGRALTVSKQVSDRPVAQPFVSRAARLGVLPTARHNDVRLSSARWDEDVGGGGPGAYSPVEPTIDAAAKRRAASAAHAARKAGLGWATQSAGGSGGVTWAGIGREQRWGKFAVSTDSSLVR